VVQPIIPALGRERQEDLKLEVSLGYVAQERKERKKERKNSRKREMERRKEGRKRKERKAPDFHPLLPSTQVS
jgi:hypothetical protein